MKIHVQIFGSEKYKHYIELIDKTKTNTLFCIDSLFILSDIDLKYLGEIVTIAKEQMDSLDIRFTDKSCFLCVK